MASAVVLAAQIRLQARRNALSAQKRDAVSVSAEIPPQALPSHLGWGSQRITKATAESTGRAENCWSENPWLSPVKSDHTNLQQPSNLQNTSSSLLAEVTVYPDVAVQILKSNQVAPARIWWLLRASDAGGQGAVSAEIARHQFTNKQSATRVCGWRQLRKLLHAGNGLFWAWDGKTIWLRSRAKVAVALGIKHVQAKPVLISAEKLTQPIAQLKATLYATFHQSRPTNPIARATIASITGLSESSQRRYEAAKHIVTKSQYAVLTQLDNQEAYWQSHAAGFPFTDHRGHHGPKGRVYLARQLPNTFSPQKHQAPTQSTKSKIRRFNRRLTDLSTLGTTGNGQRFQNRLYFAGGASVKEQGGWYPSGQSGIWYGEAAESETSYSRGLS